MNTAHLIKVFSELGHIILNSSKSNLSNILNSAITNAYISNPWFTSEFCSIAIKSIASDWLNPQNLNSWVKKYSLINKATQDPKRIAVIMAGNVPFVGFHDMLAVVITGNTFIGKTSSKDGGLMQAIIEMLKKIEPEMENRLFITDERLPEFDAVIATGSDNSARYFDYYFAKYPNIIRKNRSSIAILTGNETDKELKDLANDIFSYFGLGCRNVSTLFLPKGYNFINLIPYFESFSFIANHNKYANNYEYNRALYLMNSAPHLDNGFCLFVESQAIGTPVGVINYSYYNSQQDNIDFIELNSENIQCVVSNSNVFGKVVPLGAAQSPTLTDYADNVDTVEFLLGIGSRLK
jgi:hypothetical protein